MANKPKKKGSATSSRPKKTAVNTKGKAASKGKKEVKPEKKPLISNEIKGIIIIAVGIFLGFVFLSDMAGAVGGWIKSLCYGLFGPSMAVSCLFIILTGFFVFLNKAPEKNGFRYLLLFLIIVFTSIIVTMILGKNTFPDGSLGEIITLLWTDGVEGNGGGVIGGGLCGIISLALGVAGTWIMAIAAEIVCILLLTEISIGKTVSKVKNKIKDRREKEDEDTDSDMPKHPEQNKQVEKKLKERDKKKKNGFFDKYFDGEETVEGNDSSEEESEPRPPKRFEFQEDDEIFKDFPKETGDTQDEDLPFEIDNMKSGVITELPDENGNYEKPVENEEGTDFEPPSDAKVQDVLDMFTQKAVDNGVPLDRAVDAGRRMATEEAEDSTFEAQVEKQVKEEAKKPKIVKYKLPTTELLDNPKPQIKSREEIKSELEEKANKLLDTLRSFKVEAEIINVTQGPSVTRFELQPGLGVKVSKITNLADDIALSLAASGVRIEPVPGKSAIGVEIPNKERIPVPIREVIESDKFKKFKSKTAFALGKDIGGACVVADFADYPHALIAGGTGSGKSVCINSLIMSILFKARPDEVKMIMVDPKMVELSVYDGLPHLLIPVVTDPKHAAGALNWAVGEMKNRYKLLNESKVRNLKDYNKLMKQIGEPESKLPEIVIIIDELADLMMAAKNEVESAINSIAALARAAGMYLIIATQRPSVDVVTGVIKNNIPTRIALSVSSSVDSRIVIDTTGAEKLLGHGDMLYSPRGAAKPLRIQGNFVDDGERERVIEYIKNQYIAEYDEEVIENIEREREQVGMGNSSVQEADNEDRGGEQKDKMFYEAVELVLTNGQASVAMFQRKFGMGYQRAAKLIDQMEKYKIIGPYEGTKPRQVLITRQEFNEMKMNEPDM